MSTVGKDAIAHAQGAEPTLGQHYASVRAFTEALAEPLAAEDQVVQSMPDASPTKWHRAHTSWFFETFVLTGQAKYKPFDDRYGFLFNSYYEAVGPRHSRAARGVLSRPTVAEVRDYRGHVDGHMAALLKNEEAVSPALRARIVLGLHHEQQHQELLLTDIQHAFAANPLRPAYARSAHVAARQSAPLAWIPFGEGVQRIGRNVAAASASDRFEAFAFDNEGPSHRVFIEPFELASRAVNAGDYLAFVQDRGYARPELWLSEGWAARTQGEWLAPLYWEHDAHGGWVRFSLGGVAPVDPNEPLCHVSYYEADAFARWAGARLPTEAEWEIAAATPSSAGAFAEGRAFVPSGPTTASRASESTRLHGLLGDVWEWTSSAYAPYPGYAAEEGALGEYNGKFMCSQMVLRGGSCFTPRSHIRTTYRNFFPPGARWQMAGLRLARSR